jgi:hypothetical protein
MSEPKFMWKDGSKWLPGGGGFWATLIVYNTDNGIGSVEQKVGNSWVRLGQLNHLGNMYVMKQPNDYRSLVGPKSFVVRVSDVGGQPYGEFDVEFSCGDSVCGTPTDAKVL